MPKKDLTRRELYELVWTTPRAELAKQFKISDVAVGKLCRQMNVPAPPPGYWAHIAAKGHGKSKFVRPPLTYTVAERIEEDHEEIRKSLPAFDPKKLDTPVPPPPSLSESQDDAVERYVGLARAVPLPKPSRGTHPVIIKLVKEDDRLAALPTSYSWEKPKYQTGHGKQLLAGLNRLLWWWSDIGFEPGSSGTRHIRLYISLGSYNQSFEIATKAADTGSGGRPSSPHFEVRLDIDSRYLGQKEKPDLRFASFDTDSFFATARLLIQRREAGFRDWLRRNHEHMLWEREDTFKKDHAAKEAARQRTEAAHRALVASREKLIEEAISGMHKANQLRALVDVLDQHLSGAALERWKAWMHAKADALDIRTKSADALSEWVKDFHLSDGGH
jgi:hypothetical protein